MFSCVFGSPVGKLSIEYDDEYIYRLHFGEFAPHEFCDNEICRSIIMQLREYFGGNRRSFDLPLKLAGSEFGVKVWAALCDIPYGETRSYSQIAKAAGNQAAVRAVATLVGKNPIPIVIPCHRVIRKSGDMGKYAGGVEVKKRLLELEKGNK